MNQRRFLTGIIAVLILAFGLACFCTGCGTADQDSGQGQTTAARELTEGETDNAEDSASQMTDQKLPDPHGVYDSAEEVAAYLYAYHKLPENYMTKREAQALGWQGGSLERFAPGMCIGGDYFGNYQRNLPDDAEYHECDIDTLGADGRGPKRLVYSEDDIYYTEDHYEHFEQLYDENGRL